MITERLPGRRGTTAPMSALPPALAAWAATAELSGLTDATAETARQYLSRYFDFTPATREEFGRRIAAAVTAQVTPPPPADPARPTTCPRCSPSAGTGRTPGWPPRPARLTRPGGTARPRPGTAGPARPAERARPHPPQPLRRCWTGPDRRRHRPAPAASSPLGKAGTSPG